MDDLFLLNVYEVHFAEAIVKINVYDLFVFLLNELSSIKGFHFMALWLVLLGNVICIVLPCTESCDR